jgi:hypothetical protein
VTEAREEPYRTFEGRGRLRWRAISPEHDQVSPVWTLSVKNREVYLAQRGMRDIKISLHKSGDAHLAFVDHEKAAAWEWPESSRHLSEWSTRGEFLPGWSRLIHVVHPAPELRGFREDGIEHLEFFDFEVDRRKALYMCLLRNTGAAIRTTITFDDAVHVATFHDGKDWSVAVMAIQNPWLEHSRAWATRARTVPPGSHERSIASPNLDVDSPGARLVKFTKDSDGGRSIYDLAAKESRPRNSGNSLVKPP